MAHTRWHIADAYPDRPMGSYYRQPVKSDRTSAYIATGDHLSGRRCYMDFSDAAIGDMDGNRPI